METAKLFLQWFLFCKCYCLLSSTLLFIMQRKMILSLREGLEMVDKLHFPLGWVGAMWVYQTAFSFLLQTSLFTPHSLCSVHSLSSLFCITHCLSVFMYLCVCVSVYLRGWEVLVKLQQNIDEPPDVTPHTHKHRFAQLSLLHLTPNLNPDPYCSWQDQCLCWKRS